MCRRSQIQAVAILAFGLGLLVSCWVETLFWRACFGICFLGMGILRSLKK
ncbi:MAG: hypothetical protein IJW45_04825 [Oscillospiraceae bacterium]|nr:hypothetical protein [Oscillospiraceae bacterium]